MRFTPAIIASAAFIMPAQALACANHNAHQHCAPHHHHAIKTIHVTPNSMAVSREVGVMVYRGSSAKPDYAAVNAVKARQEAAAQTAKRQAKLRRAEARRVDARLTQIEGKLDDIKTNEKADTRRNIYGYGRRYRGNNRFFGANGFAGNSNFSGASVPLRRVRRSRH